MVGATAVLLWVAVGAVHAGSMVERPLDPVSEQIRDEVELLRAAQPGSPGDVVLAFYEQHQFAPAWTRPQDVDQLLDALGHLDRDGLDPQDYSLAELQRGRAALRDPRATARQRAQFDLLATDACLTALLHLSRGKVDPATLDPGWNIEAAPFDRSDGMRWVRDALSQERVGALFERARPHHPLYDELRMALAQLRKIAAQGGWPMLEPGDTLEPGARDPRVPALRQRLSLGGFVVGDPEVADLYAPVLQAAVRQFQQEQYLLVDGRVGAATRAALNVTTAARIDQVRANLERSRWLLHQLRGNFVMVDIAGYTVAYYEDGRPVWHARAQVGKPYRRTPVFKSQITYLTLNPTWTVPPTILRHDVLPKVRRDPGYLAANRIRVLDQQGRTLAPSSVDWNQPRGIVLRQDSGPGNALGRLAIRFPNPYSVYLHDTPHQALFANEQRANSSGCIRVERARELAVLLLNAPTAWDRLALDRAIDTNRTQTVMLRQPVPLLLAYWTVELRDGDRLAYRPDVYRRDATLLAALQRPRSSRLPPSGAAAMPAGH